MQARPWHKVWPEGVPKELDSEFEPIHKAILLDKPPEKCALIQAEDLTCITFKNLKRMTESIASWLQSKGAGKGTQVAFSARNTIQAIAALLGSLATGARTVLIDPLTIGEDLAMQLEGREFTAYIMDSEFYRENKDVVKEAGISRVLLTDQASSEKTGDLEVTSFTEALLARGYSEPEIGELDDSIALYYSGIAGRTMQAIHHHRGLYTSSKALALMAGLGEKDSSLLVASITHVLGLQLSLLSPLLVGATVIAMKRWNKRLAKSLVSEGLVTYIAGAPLMHEQLIAEADEAMHGKLRLGISAGAPLKPETQDQYREKLGAPLVQAYGMTESLVITLQPIHLAHVKGTLGIPLPSVDVKLVDPEDPVKELGPGETGELLARAPWIMKGYEYPEENEKAFINGWLRTGDLIYMDENGLLYFRGVRKRLIKYKAYAILPRDLEIILERHPAVARAIVYGEPDEEVGQKPAARVWLKKGERVSEEELMEYVNSRVAFYKKIRKITI
ncbi:MAG: acyl--CoA ligase, partial [Desulfurococcales archaeon]|nr:acyl--CoA ligase [Desulfurococcales archaeon]